MVQDQSVEWPEHSGESVTRFSSKAKAQMASGQGSHWLIESPTF